MKVSVCVPAFERVEYLSRLIQSVRAQDYPDTEVCISDDSRDGSVEAYIATLREPWVRYERNPGRRGLGPNLQHALAMASGEIAVVLGDDDMLSCPDALRRYVEAAVRYPTARFFYPNHLQIDTEDRVSFVHRYFSEERYYAAGAESFAATWLRSVQIAGMGFRLAGDGIVVRLFPDEPCLFPQVVAVGHLVARGGSVGMARYLVSPRGHALQLGGQAAQGKLVSSLLEQRGAAELLSMLRSFADQYPDEMRSQAPSLERHIVVNFAGSMPNILLTAGRPALRRLTSLVFEESPYARRSVWLRILYVGLCVAPAALLESTVHLLKRAQLVVRRTRSADLLDLDRSEASLPLPSATPRLQP